MLAIWTGRRNASDRPSPHCSRSRQANKAKYGVDYGKKPEYRYFARYVEEARMAYDGVCSGACTGEDEQCFGSTTAVDYCLQGEVRSGCDATCCGQ